MSGRLWGLSVGIGVLLLGGFAAYVWLGSKVQDGEPWPLYPGCYGHPDYDACAMFVDQCAGCHSGPAVVNVDAPDLVGLIGRTRTFASGESLVADEAYILRSITNHSDESEWIPGYGTEKTQLRELSERTLSSEEVAALVGYIQSFEPYPLVAEVRISQEWAVEDGRAQRIERLMKAASDPLRACYQVALVDHPEVRGSYVVEFRADHASGFGGKVVESSVSNAITIGCVEYSISPYEWRTPAEGPVLARYNIELLSRPAGD